jgi:hypothetical protein
MINHLRKTPVQHQRRDVYLQVCGFPAVKHHHKQQSAKTVLR